MVHFCSEIDLSQPSTTPRFISHKSGIRRLTMRFPETLWVAGSSPAGGAKRQLRAHSSVQIRNRYRAMVQKWATNTQRLADLPAVVLLVARAAAVALVYGVLLAAGHNLALAAARPNVAFWWVTGGVAVGAVVLAVWLTNLLDDTTDTPAEDDETEPAPLVSGQCLRPQACTWPKCMCFRRAEEPVAAVRQVTR